MPRPLISIFGLNGGQGFAFNGVTFTNIRLTHNLLQLTQPPADMTVVKVSGGDFRLFVGAVLDWERRSRRRNSIATW